MAVVVIQRSCTGPHWSYLSMWHLRTALFIHSCQITESPIHYNTFHTCYSVLSPLAVQGMHSWHGGPIP